MPMSTTAIRPRLISRMDTAQDRRHAFLHQRSMVQFSLDTDWSQASTSQQSFEAPGIFQDIAEEQDDMDDEAFLPRKPCWQSEETVQKYSVNQVMLGSAKRDIRKRSYAATLPAQRAGADVVNEPVQRSVSGRPRILVKKATKQTMGESLMRRQMSQKMLQKTRPEQMVGQGQGPFENRWGGKIAHP